jgi:hypothetical protein
MIPMIIKHPRKIDLPTHYNIGSILIKEQGRQTLVTLDQSGHPWVYRKSAEPNTRPGGFLYDASVNELCRREFNEAQDRLSNSPHPNKIYVEIDTTKSIEEFKAE